MSSETDELIKRKLDWMITKDLHLTEEFKNLQSAGRSERMASHFNFFLAITGIILTIALLVFSFWAEMNIWIPLLLVIGAIFKFSYAYQRRVKCSWRYKTIDAFRQAVIVSGNRSIDQIAKFVKFNPNEVVDALKEMQGMGLFLNFSVDRENKTLVEDQDWGFGSSELYERYNFICNNCAAPNDLYKLKSAKNVKCEYCSAAYIFK
jgi:hypothetical protein